MEQHDKCVCRYLKPLPSNNVSRAASQQHTYQQKLVATLTCLGYCRGYNTFRKILKNNFL